MTTGRINQVSSSFNFFQRFRVVVVFCLFVCRCAFFRSFAFFGIFFCCCFAAVLICACFWLPKERGSDWGNSMRKNTQKKRNQKKQPNRNTPTTTTNQEQKKTSVCELFWLFVWWFWEWKAKSETMCLCLFQFFRVRISLLFGCACEFVFVFVFVFVFLTPCCQFFKKKFNNSMWVWRKWDVCKSSSWKISAPHSVRLTLFCSIVLFVVRFVCLLSFFLSFFGLFQKKTKAQTTIAQIELWEVCRCRAVVVVVEILYVCVNKN